MTNLATLAGYLIIERRGDRTYRLASADLIADRLVAERQLFEHEVAEYEVNGNSTYVVAEVHEVEEAP